MASSMSYFIFGRIPPPLFPVIHRLILLPESFHGAFLRLVIKPVSDKIPSMKCLSLLLFLILVSGCISTIQSQAPPTGPVTGSVYFPPQGGETEAIVRELDKAQNSILVQGYSFFSAPVTQALVGAQEKGVNVQILIDHSSLSRQSTGMDILAKASIPIKIESAKAADQNKVIIIDGETVITESPKFTKSGENLLVIRHKAIAEKYIKNWKEHAGHSEPYVVRDK